MFNISFSCILFLFFSGIICENEYNFNWHEFQSIIKLQDLTKNHTKTGCVWRSPGGGYQCPDSDINFYLYSGQDKQMKQKINPSKKNSLPETLWDPYKHNIVYIHGYGGGDGIFPNNILRNAYINNGSYNLFVVDWGSLAKLPCYTAAVYNLNAMAKCTAELYKNFRSQGVPSHKITCVGHSLGAHGCGLISNYINFRMHRIIGLDPAGPMIPSFSRLRPGMAESVQVMHTNSGVFGDSTSSGRVNFCINGGKTQPICDGTSFGSDLCSHLVALCYMAESIDSSTARKAMPCPRQCPYGPRTGQKSVYPVLVGQHTPDKATGSYCTYTSDPPYCPKGRITNGDPWCCFGKRTEKKFKEVSKQWHKIKTK